MNNILFEKTLGSLTDVSEDSNPYDYFRLLLDVSLLVPIVSETNKSVKDTFSSGNTMKLSNVTF